MMRKLSNYDAVARNCPVPYQWGSNEKRCGLCAIVWQQNEDKPECSLKLLSSKLRSFKSTNQPIDKDERL